MNPIKRTNPFRFLILFITILLITITVGCSSTMTMYDGPTLPDEKIARVKTDNTDIRFNSIDGKNPLSCLSSMYRKYPQEILLKPGRHFFTVKYFTDRQYSFGYFRFDALAGKTYTVKHLIYEKKRMRFWLIEDKTGKTVKKTPKEKLPL